ncbi:MAG: sugar MFS transporter [Microcystaceae cyanobacterium]
MNLGLTNVFLPLFSFGVAIAFLGAIKLPLAQRLTLNDAQIARFFILAPLANVIGTFIAGYWLVGLSYQLVIVGGFILILFALILIAQFKQSLLLMLAILSLGLGGSFLNLGSNALLAVLVPDNPASITNFAHACFGVGALILPIILTYLLRRFPWRYAISGITLFLILPTIPALISTYPSSVMPDTGEIGLDLILHPTMILAMLVAFFYVGIESAIAIWTTTYLRYIGWETLTASSLISLFWLGLMGGRIITGLVVNSANSEVILQGSILLTIITFMIMTRFLFRGLSIAAILVLGISFAPIFPTLTGWLFVQFDANLSGTIYALISGTAMMGSSLIPFIVGSISEKFSIIRGFQLLLIPSSCLFVLSWVMVR